MRFRFPISRANSPLSHGVAFRASDNGRTREVVSMMKRFLFFTALLAVSGTVASAQAPVTISGTVTSDAGVPLPSVNVLIPGLNFGTQADDAGHYSFTVPASRANGRNGCRPSSTGSSAAPMPGTGRRGGRSATSSAPTCRSDDRSRRASAVAVMGRGLRRSGRAEPGNRTSVFLTPRRP